MMNALQSFMLWFYCLEIPEAVLIILAATELFLLLKDKAEDKCWWNCLVGAALACWALAVVWTTVWVRTTGETFQHNFTPFHSYRDIFRGGNPEISRSNFMNIVLFYPAGLLAASLLPRKWPRWCRCILVVSVLGMISIGIEYLQYRYMLGRCEIDDIIHNAAGALLGCLGALLLPRLYAYRKEKAQNP